MWTSNGRWIPLTFGDTLKYFFTWLKRKGVKSVLSVRDDLLWGHLLYQFQKEHPEFFAFVGGFEWNERYPESLKFSKWCQPASAFLFYQCSREDRIYLYYFEPVWLEEFSLEESIFLNSFCRKLFRKAYELDEEAREGTPKFLEFLEEAKADEIS